MQFQKEPKTMADPEGVSSSESSYSLAEPESMPETIPPYSAIHVRAFRLRSRPLQNIVSRLAHRQTAIFSPAEEHYEQRKLHVCVFPSYTESRVEVPNNCFLRKFSPDGNHLLAFSQDQCSVEVYFYRGAGAGNHLYSDVYTTEDIKGSIFGYFFVYKFSVLVCKGGEVLNRECSLFTVCGRYVIVGASCLVPDDPYPHMFETFRNNESLSPSTHFMLEDINIYTIDLFRGCVTDNVSFKCDKILLAHNQCISLCDSKMAVLSLQHQTIHLFELVEGSFIHLQDIGRFCYPDDELLFREANFTQTSAFASTHSTPVYQPFLEKWLNSLKHRFLCRLLEQVKAASGCQDKASVSLFFKRFDYFNSLRIWKMQLMDEDTLLLKYTTEQTVTLRQSEAPSQRAFYAIYDIASTEMLAVYENSSLELLRLFEQYADLFRSAVSHPAALHTSSVSNCPYAHALHMKFKQTITNAKYSGVGEATKRLLMQLPVCSQSFSSSPYLDLSLFSYDDKWISPMERPKPLGDNYVK